MPVVVVSDLWDTVLPMFEKEAAPLRHETAAHILAAAQENAPEVSGGLKASGYIIDEQGSGYSAAVAAAQGKNPGIGVLPEVQAEADTTIIAFAADYAHLNEFYTGPANPGAHPYLGPAAEAERPAFDAAIQRLGA